ncbi:BBP7 family outer membrane beta-barrel protein [Rhodopirellula halodulae]|uniref:BBP7 family outer membrane beta-barrel protein n=1 Tax=Rhodopirellula halodulae TaxID=2894198 RepID=UPI001E3498E4|nr:BBP7 family outer membrane beta-barrel protein [Rhodopirellula sp. JC737]MCC9656466.1 BBP7 family outer membrane beta-barrel protein [Rhodopirellula sp. JC737]
MPSKKITLVQSCFVAIFIATPHHQLLANDSSFYVGGLLLERVNQSDPLLANAVADSTRQITGDDLQHELEGGFELTITKAVSQHVDSEIRYFGWFEDSATATLSTTPAELIRLNTAVPINATAGSRVVAEFSSSLHNFEANCRRQVNEDFQLLFGLRYLHLDEGLTVGSPDSASETTIAIDSRNDLFGTQIGLHSSLITWNRLSVGLQANAGIMLNHADQNSTATTTISTLRSIDDDVDVAFLGELKLQAGYKLNNSIEIFTGYHALWLSDVVLADSQLANTNFFARNGLNNSSDVLFHGLSTGIQFRY